MRYRNIIFDFDGTLADTASLIIATMHETISALGLPEKSDAECRSMIGYRLEDNPAILWPEIPDLSELYAATYRKIFKTVKESYDVKLYPHVRETLNTLKREGVNMAIASSRSRISLQEYCEKLGIADYFPTLVGGGEVAHGKPSPEPVNLILATQGWNKHETLVVGDMDVDILMGRAAGTDTCAVTYGNGTPAALKAAGANYIISDFAKLLKL